MVSSLSEQLRLKLTVNEKVKVLEQFINELAKHIEDNIVPALSARSEECQANIEAIRSIRADIAVMKTGGHTPSNPETVSTQTMCSMGECTGNPEKAYVLKHFARQYCSQHGLEIKRGEGKSSQEWFPFAAAEYAVKKMRESFS